MENKITLLFKDFKNKQNYWTQENFKIYIQDILNYISFWEYICIAWVKIAKMNHEVWLYEIIKSKFWLLDSDIKSQIYTKLQEKSFSHIIDNTQIKEILGWEEVLLNYQYIQQNIPWDCVLTSVANAISLIKGKLPKNSVYELRNSAITNRMLIDNLDYPPIEILEDNSSLDNWDYFYLVKNNLDIGIGQSNMLLIDWALENNIIVDKLMNIFDLLEEGKYIFLGLNQHASFIKKVWKHYYLFDSMINEWMYKFQDELNVINYLKLNLTEYDINFMFYI